MPVPTGGTLRIEEPPEPRDSKVHCLYYMVETPVSSTVRMTEEKAAEMLRDLTRRFERGELPLTWNTVFKPLPGHFYIHLRNNVMHHPAQDGYFWTTPQDVKLAYTISDREEVVVYKSRGALTSTTPPSCWQRPAISCRYGGVHQYLLSSYTIQSWGPQTKAKYKSHRTVHWNPCHSPRSPATRTSCL
eukprot:comp18180_c1_seq1/m.19017 comp18180_c1_seq1/g.19017  ORF comp18180_c1_seq1/g.19017 comp18180_c1_seq1/m.19017 type:complete len:188 (-) comp18180_c1_seq1:12-575(-)